MPGRLILRRLLVGLGARPEICWYDNMCERMYGRVVAVEALGGLYKRCQSFYASRCRVEMVEGRKEEKRREKKKRFGFLYRKFNAHFANRAFFFPNVSIDQETT